MRYSLLFAAAALALGGCAGSADQVNPAGNHPDLGMGNVKAEGVLRVRGASPSEGVFKTQQEETAPPPVVFSVYDAEGKLLTKSTDEEICLPAGRYLIRPESGTHPSSAFWVTVASDKTTEVDLRLLDSKPMEAK